MALVNEVFIVIDGNSLGKASYQAGRNFKTSTGIGTGTSFLFLRTYKMLLKKHNPAMIFIAWDSWPTWRHQHFAEYKASRKKDDEYYQQREMLQNILASMNKNVQAWAKLYEADDIAADIVRQNPEKDFILVTEDSDWFQLVNPNVSVYRHKKKDFVTIGNFLKQTGFSNPEELVETKAIRGDGTDEIPGLFGVSESVCRRYLRGELDDPERVRIDEYMGTEQYKKMRSLIELRDMNIVKELYSFRKAEWDKINFLYNLEKLEFKSFMRDYDIWAKLMEVT
jgi:DNA polymerase-1